MKHPNLIGLFIAFMAGQAIQLLTCAMAHNLYVSDPVLMCVTVGVVATVVVILASIFTSMENESKETHSFHEKKEKQDDNYADIIPAVFRDWRKRPALDTDPVNITEEDDNVRKENVNA